MTNEMKGFELSVQHIKIIIAIASLSIIFLSPYLSITTISLDMNLLQSAGYAILILGFWAIALKTLRSKHAPLNDPQPLHHHKPITTNIITG